MMPNVTTTVAIFAGCLACPNAALKDAKRMPAGDEALHLAISGRFALWNFVEAALSLAGCKIETLHVCTLGFSKRNVRRMTEASDTGRKRSASCDRLESARRFAFSSIVFLAKPFSSCFLRCLVHVSLAPASQAVSLLV
jgi:hypothetical protein